MSFLLFLFVFVITYNNGIARPMIDGDLNIVTENRMGTGDSDVMRYKMPTTVKIGTTVNVKGILDTTAQMFKVALVNNNEAFCNITLNFSTKDITVNPAIEGYDTTNYDFNLEGEPTFIFKLIPRENTAGKRMTAIQFQINEKGPSSQLICDIDCENIIYMDMQEGVAHVNDLDFKFMKNR